MSLSDTMRPLNDNIFVTRIRPKDVTAGGIYIPDTAQLKSRMGLVVAVGPGRLLENGNRVPIPVKVGDKIWFKGTSGEEIKMSIDGEEYVALKESELEAVIEDE